MSLNCFTVCDLSVQTDVLVVSCDFISDLSLQRFADKHRRHDSSATALLAPTSLAFANMDKAKVTGTNSMLLESIYLP